MKNYYDGQTCTPETNSGMKREFRFELGLNLHNLQSQHESLVKILNAAPNSPRPSNEYDDLANLEAVLRHMIESHGYSTWADLVEEGTDARLRQMQP